MIDPSTTVFGELRFWALVAFSLVVPAAIYWMLLTKRAISRNTVLLMGVAFLLIAGLDLYLLRHLEAAARRTPSLADDALFLSEVSLALYLLPALFGGTGINLISHVLIAHLTEAERHYDEDHPAK
jgi:high-affinity Fe2+/Pb2+ permease